MKVAVACGRIQWLGEWPDMDVRSLSALRVTSCLPAATDIEVAPFASVIVIPARLASTRLPRKLLLRETGKPLIQHTYEAAAKATRPSGVLVAADCEEIGHVVRAFGGRV